MLRWQLRLSRAANADYQHILVWTEEHFGRAQAIRYARILSKALHNLTAKGPEALGAREREDIAPGFYSFHFPRARHIVLFRAREGTVDVIRILHDSMDPTRHLPEDS